MREARCPWGDRARWVREQEALSRPQGLDTDHFSSCSRRKDSEQVQWFLSSSFAPELWPKARLPASSQLKWLQRVVGMGAWGLHPTLLRFLALPRSDALEGLCPVLSQVWALQAVGRGRGSFLKPQSTHERPPTPNPQGTKVLAQSPPNSHTPEQGLNGSLEGPRDPLGPSGGSWELL